MKLSCSAPMVLPQLPTGTFIISKKTSHLTQTQIPAFMVQTARVILILDFS